MTIFYANLDFESTERFDLGRFLEFNIDNYDILNSFFIVEFLKLPSIGKFTINGEEQSPDYISKKLYDRHEYWWLLMYFNGITDFQKLKNGMVLEYFSVSDLESLYFKMKSLEVLKGTDQFNIGNTTVSSISSSSTDKNYIYNQIILQSVWIINHPLKKRPSITVVTKNVDGNEEVVKDNDFTVIFPLGKEELQVIITFPSAIRGKVILN